MLRKRKRRLVESQEAKPIKIALIALSLVVSQLTALLPAVLAKTSSFNAWQGSEKFNVLQADDAENGIYLIGLFDIHHSSAHKPSECGLINTDVDLEWKRPMQNLEAFLWAIEQVNKDQSLLPGVKLGSISLDTCSSLFRSKHQLANLLLSLQDARSNLSTRRIAAIVADNADWQSIEATASMSSALGLTTFVTQSRSSELGKVALGRATGSRGKADEEDLNKGWMSELIGMRRRLPSKQDFEHVQVTDANFELANSSSPKNELYMIRMAPGNEVLADAIAAFVQRMNWDLVSLVYDEDHSEMTNLRDELLRQFVARNIKLAVEEQISTRSPPKTYDQLLASLAGKAEDGSRVVITLVVTGGARLLLDSLRNLRRRAGAGPLLEQVNQLLWLTVADREPYYTFGPDSLGTVAVSSSASLPVEFKNHFDGPRLEERNRWWSEYLDEIFLKQLSSNKLTSDCVYFPNRVKDEQKCINLLSSKRNSISSLSQQFNKATKISKYFAAGWEHNGLEVINSVLAAAKSLEAVRQRLCPKHQTGICDGMRQHLHPASPQDIHSRLLPTISQLMFEQLRRSSFQLADGRTFNTSNLLADTNFKLYNLRHLQANSIGFVKFGHYNQVEGLKLNVSKARYYPAGLQDIAGHESLETLRSTCENENRCPTLEIIDSSSSANSEEAAGDREEVEELALGSLFKLDHPAIIGSGNSVRLATDRQSVEEQSTKTTNTSSSSADLPGLYNMLSSASMGVLSKSWPFDGSRKVERNERQLLNTIVLLALHGEEPESSPESTALTAGSCRESAPNSTSCKPPSILGSQPNDGCPASNSERLLDIQHSFQRLAALGFAQNMANIGALKNASQGSRDPQIEMTTTVIDYCGRGELARKTLANRLNDARQRRVNGETVAVIDFGGQISEGISQQLSNSQLLHITLGSEGGKGDFHRMFAAKSEEIRALIELIRQVGKQQWKLVHLIYTDHHSYRDQFVRAANEANICVNKLIWIPALGATQNDLQSTRKLFKREFYDFSSAGSNRANSTQTTGLNSTRVLVVLASKDADTNRLIARAATDSMRKDYVWLVSHEWLHSVESELDVGSSFMQGNQEEKANVARQMFLPNILATRPQSSDSRDFRGFYSTLSPAAHAPLPTVVFDRFWQQQFNCRLPIASSERAWNAKLPECDAMQKLNGDQLELDELVHETIEVYLSLAKALGSVRQADYKSHRLRQEFDKALRERHSLSAVSLETLGFHILHRPKPEEPRHTGGSGRRKNSRDLSSEFVISLAQVGMWRDGHLMLVQQQQQQQQQPAPDSEATPAGTLEPRATAANHQPDSGETNKLAASLANLSSFRSTCSTKATCSSCFGQTKHSPAFGWDTNQTTGGTVAAKGWFSELHRSSDSKKSERSTIEDDLHSMASTTILSQAPAKQVSSLDSTLILDLKCTDMQRHWSLPFNVSLSSFNLVACLSLLGTVCITISMTYLYPKKLKRASLSSAHRASPDSKFFSLNDYFLLTGLLMLCSINVAFLLPVTMSVCWLRRVGLCTSYTTIITSILVRLLSLASTPTGNQLSEASQALENKPEDEVEEDIEVTFESLPHDPTIISANQPSAEPMQQPRAMDQQVEPGKTKQHQNQMGSYSSKKHNSGLLLGISVALILLQFLLSIVWSLWKPFEPTLYQGCWRCHSPVRSPSLLIYEPLLSLVYPALLLLPTWILSIVLFRTISNNEKQFRRIVNQSTIAAQSLSAFYQFKSSYEEELKLQLKDSRSYILSTTSLVLVWSTATLNMISTKTSSSSYNEFREMFSANAPPNARTLSSLTHNKTNNLNLVYANLASSAIIFILLFLYRLRLFSSLNWHWKAFELKKLFRFRRSFTHRFSVRKFLKLNQKQQSQPQTSANNFAQQQENNDGNYFNLVGGSCSSKQRLRLQRFNNYYTCNSSASNSINLSELFQGQTRNRSRKSSSRIAKVTRKTRAAPASSSSATIKADDANDKDEESRFQRCQSVSSLASSTRKLVASESNSCDFDTLDDGISYSSSIASSSTSQLHGSELYPLDYSIQLDTQNSCDCRETIFTAAHSRKPQVKTRHCPNRRSFKSALSTTGLSLVRE